MPSKTIRVILSAVVIVGALGFFMAQTLSENLAYFKHVDEVMAQPDEWYGKNMQLHGYVVPGSIEGKIETMEWRFQVQHQNQVVRASYRGIVPDTFQDDAEVVLKGHLTAEGFQVEPGGVMAKCPSKYEPGKYEPGKVSSR
jgi:cytochrome c-type biogenesis protein CcmE